MLIDKDGNLYCSKHCNQEKEVLEKDTNKIICPECNKGYLIQRIATKGKNKGNIFFGCSTFPKCKNIISKEEYYKLTKNE